MGKRLKACPVMLPAEDWEELKEEAKEEDRSASSIIRPLVAEHLKRRRRTKQQAPTTLSS